MRPESLVSVAGVREAWLARSEGRVALLEESFESDIAPAVAPRLSTNCKVRQTTESEHRVPLDIYQPGKNKSRKRQISQWIVAPTLLREPLVRIAGVREAWLAWSKGRVVL